MERKIDCEICEQEAATFHFVGKTKDEVHVILHLCDECKIELLAAMKKAI
mgnify:CR=1 FL=1